MYERYMAVENTVRKGEIACNKQFLLFSQCFLPYMSLIFHFKCTLKCHLKFVSVWTSLKFCHLVMGLKFCYLGNGSLERKKKNIVRSKRYLPDFYTFSTNFSFPRVVVKMFEKGVKKKC